MVNPLNVRYIKVYFIGGENVHIELIQKSIMLHSSTEECNILFTQGRISENGVFVGESLNSVVISTSKTACGKKIDGSLYAEYKHNNVTTTRCKRIFSI